jgi:hypothetical protein
MEVGIATGLGLLRAEQEPGALGVSVPNPSITRHGLLYQRFAR